MIPLGILGTISGAAAAFDPSSDFLISEQILTASAASVTFSAIPTDYKHLQIRVVGRTDRANSLDYLRITINGDSGVNYSWHALEGNSGTASSSSSATQPGITIANIAGASATTSAFGAAIIDLTDFFAIKNKTLRSQSGTAANAYYSSIRSGLWMSTATPTTIQITSPFSANFIAGSRFSLYGSLG